MSLIQRGTLDVRCKEFVEYSREIYIYIDRNINTNIHETTILVTPTLILCIFIVDFFLKHSRVYIDDCQNIFQMESMEQHVEI